MNTNLKSFLTSVVVCTVSAFLLTSCYTVKGAVQGAGKDVSVLVGPENSGRHVRTVKQTKVVHTSYKTPHTTTHKTMHSTSMTTPTTLKEHVPTTTDTMTTTQ